MGEIGSLLNPSEAEIDELKAAAASCSDDLFASATKTKLEGAAAICEKLSRRFTCTVANPPYMGSSSFNPFMSKWVKKNYSDVKSDLFSSFIVRIMDFANEHGEVGMMTPFVWMFIGSYEKLRNRLIDDKTLTTLIQLEYSGFAGQPCLSAHLPITIRISMAIRADTFVLPILLVPRFRLPRRWRPSKTPTAAGSTAATPKPSRRSPALP